MDLFLRRAFCFSAPEILRKSLLRCCILGASLFFGVNAHAQFDLALIKTLAFGQPDTVDYGQTVTFRVTIFNQGTQPAYNILVLDYVPAGMTFNAAQNSGWLNFGAGPTWFIPGPLPPGGTLSRDIKLVVNNLAQPGFINNYAEITSADNDLNSGNAPPVDIDSTPNAFLFDDPGGQPGSPADNIITGDGTGAPGSSDPATDEDDHDGAAVVLYVPILSFGNLVWHDINNNGLKEPEEPGIDGVEVILFNTADTIIGNNDDTVVDIASTSNGGWYDFTGIPEGYYYLELAGGIPSNFVSSTGDGPYDMDGAGPYEPGINGDLNNTDHGTQSNNKVISGLFALFYETEPTDDGDTDWNTNLTADFGLYEPQPLPTQSIGNLVFYDLDNDGIFNNNDYGLEGVKVVLYDAGPDTLAGTADDLVLDSMLTNPSGGYLFSGLSAGFYFIKLTGEGIPTDFVSSTGNGQYDTSGSGPYEPSTEADVNESDHGSHSQGMVVSGVVEITVDGEPVDDGDSDPNTNLTIDFGLYKPLPPFDLALRLELFTQAVLTPGDTALLKVTVFNQAIATADNIGLTLRNPSSSAWDGTNITYLDDTTSTILLSVANGLLPSGGLLPGEMIMINLPLHILPGFTGDGLTVLAEISSAADLDGLDQEDNDSQFDSDFTNDVVGGDNLIDNSNGDEDDHDYAFLPVGRAFDLELVKFLAPGQSAGAVPGDQVQYFIKITNQGDIPVANVAVHDFIPAGMILNPNDPNWAMVSTGVAAYTFAGPVMPGAADSIAIFLKMQYGATGAILSNFAEIQSVTDTLGNFIPDNDSTPANSQTGEDDQDEAVVEVAPHDPTGWIYCDKTGKVITGGAISVTGPNGIPNDQVILIEDGSNGYYEFFTDGTPGVYTITYNHPSGYPLSVNCLPGPGPYDPTGMPDPITLGVDTAGMYLSDTACASNPYYLEFDLEPGDPFIFLNNIPVQCATISSVVCEDTNHNDTRDAGDAPIPGATVYLYDCSNPGVAIDSVMTDAQGRYLFDGLTPGDYSVGYVIPAGYRIVAGGPINNFGFSSCFTLNWGDCDTTNFICIYECPAVDAGPDVTICAGDTTQLQASVPYGSGSFTWSPSAGLSDPAVANPLAYPSATTTYTVAFDDGIGCTASDSLTVSVTTTTPFLTYTPFTDSTAECGTPLPFEAPQFADACDTMLTVTLDSVITPQPCGYLLERTWTATNYQGNSAGFTQNIVVTDTTPPAMSASHAYFGAINHGDTLYADCSQIPSLDSLGFSAFDLCSATTVNFTENVTLGNCDVEGFVELRYCGWTATDECGNTDSLFFTVIVRDTTPPTLTGVPADVTVECFNIPDTAVVTVSDNCDTLVNLTFDETVIPAFSGCDSLIIRTWSSIDDCGNFVSASQNITVIDTTPPSMSANHAYFGNINHGDTLYANCTQIPSLDSIGFLAFDLCSATTLTFTENITQGDCDVDGFIEWRYCGWTATDACGNTDSLFFTFIVIDTTPPVMSASHAFFGNISHGDTLYADCTQIPSLDSLGFSAYDLCSATTVNFTENVIQGDCDVDGFVEWRYCGWTASDDCGNLDSLYFTVIVRDTVPPVLNGVPADVTAECSNLPDTALVTASDLCDTLVDLTFNETTIQTAGGCDSLVIRTWTAVDDCGNMAVASQTITVIDTTPPVMSANHAFFGNINHGDTLYADCTQIASLDSLGFAAYDLCSATTVTFTENVTPGSCNVEGYLELRHCGWTATDACGNTDSLFFTVIIWDTLSPVLSAYPTDTTYACASQVPPAPMLTATDNCDPDVPVIFNETTTGNPAGCNFEITRTWTATDSCGNATIWTQTIFVSDSIPPTLSAYPADTTYTCSSDVPAAPVLTATDNCASSVPVFFVETTNGNPAGCNFEITRTWTATDSCGNQTVWAQTIVVNDTVPPTLSAPPANLTLSCETPIPPPATLTATDNCDPDVPVIFTESYFGDTTSGCHLRFRTWTATDDCGNTATVTQFIMITDFTPPTLHNVPPNQTVSCENVPGNVVTATDNCDSDVPVTITDMVTANPSGCISQIKRTWTAADDCGNIAFATRTFFITNDDAPVITITNPMMAGVSDGDTLYLECQQIMGLSVNDVSVTEDCCGAPAVTFHEFISASGDCQAFGYHQVMTCGWVATDCCGNTDSLFFTVFVVDNTAPLLLGVPNDTTLACGDLVPPPANVQGVDNCDNAVIVMFSADTVSTGGGTQIIRTWTAVDACGNAASDMQVITITGDQAPNIFNVPANLTVYSPADVPPPATNIVLSDDCDPNPQLFFNEQKIGSGDCCYQLIRTWTAVDFAGNSNSSSQYITVADTLAPVISGVPADLTVACDWVEPVAPAVTASDNCALNPALTVSQDTVFAACGFTITRTWSAADECGNLTSASQTITVTDTEAPQLSGIPADLPVACMDTLPAAPVVTAMDNCDGTVPVIFTETQQGSGCSYQVVRTWTAVDACGNLVSASQTITVSDDSTPPVLAGVPADVNVECTNIPTPANVTATDNCSSATVTLSETVTGTCPQVITRTWTAVDACGNSVSASQTITVNDTQPPVLSAAPADLTVSCGSDVPAAATLTATDNCDTGVTVIFIETTNGSGCSYTIERTWMATDECGNGTIFTQFITVEDMEAPVLANTPDDVTVLCDAVPQPANVTASDNCDTSVTLLFDENINGNGCSYTIERTWTATDDCGNGTSFTQIITVNDTEAPVLANTPDDLTVACDAISQPANVTASDNCDDNVTLFFDEIINGSGCSYTIERTWTATDDCGNGTSFTQIITVEDTFAPAFAFVPADVTVDCGETVPPFGDPIVEDDCSGVILTSVTDSIATVDGYDLTRTWTAADSCGNSSTVTQTISVTTAGPPMLHGVPNDTIIILANGDVVPDPANVTATDGCDSTATVPVIFNENSTPNGCDTIIVRTWSATGSGGLTVSDSQVITVIVELQVTASTTPDTCGLADGTATLTPDAYSYTWSDGGTGADRNGLAAGTYTVTVTSGNCSDTLMVTVDSICPCDQAEVSSLILTDATCGNSDGSANIQLVQDVTNYKFIWLPMLGTPNAAGNVRANLPSGHYFVYIVLKTDNGCVEKLEFDLADNCIDTLVSNDTNQVNTLAGIFTEKQTVVSGNCTTDDLGYCLDIPFAELNNYQFEINGQLYGGTFGVCTFFEHHFYSYAALPGLGQTGPYEVVNWQVDGQVFDAVFQKIEDLPSLLNAWDEGGNWSLDTGKFSIAGGRTGGTYSSLKVKHGGTGTVAHLQLNSSTAPGSAFLELPEGASIIVATRLSDQFRDTLTALTACVTPDYFETTIEVNQRDTVLLNLTELPGTVTGVVCTHAVENDPAALVESIEGLNAVQISGLRPGAMKACVVVSDDYGISDTTWVQVTVRGDVETVLHFDTLYAAFETKVSGNVLANDVLSAKVKSLEIVDNAKHGYAEVNPDFTVTYTPHAGYCNQSVNAGPDKFFYEVCLDDGRCHTSVVFVEVACEKLNIVNGFSPNGDGVNDFFRIDGLQQYPDHELSIFNRWGGLVFKTKNYGSDWGGSWGANNLPDGTYFYILNAGGGERYSGFVEIRR